METELKIYTLPNASDNDRMLGLKNWYVDAVEGMGDILVELTFFSPVSLHYSKYKSKDRTGNIHTMKRLFFLKGNYANCMHEPATTPDGMYYVPSGSRSRGFPLYAIDRLVEVKIIDNTSDYTKNWQTIADSMVKHNINLAVAKDIQEHLSCKTEHINGFQNYWKKTDKPRCMSFKDVLKETGVKTIDALKKITSPSKYSVGMMVYVKRINGTRRDRSINLSVDADGSISYTAASEYAGCGNGDYYMMYSPTMAFYAETD